MKLKKIFVYLTVFSFLLISELPAQNIPNNITGITLSNQVYNFLNVNNFNPKKEYLVSNGKNNFPYNVILSFNQKSDIKKNVIFIFNQEEVISNRDLIKNFCQECKSGTFPTTILFAYGQKQPLQHQTSISGTSVFIDTDLDTSQSSIVLVLNLHENKNSITSASNGKTSPSWLIKNLYNLILKSNLDFKLPPYYLSQLYTFSFSKDPSLDEFFNVDIPCVKLSFEKSLNTETISTFLTEVIKMFDESTPMNFDQHFLILNIFGKYFRMNEQFMVICVICIIFIFLVFLFLLFFIDSKRRTGALVRLKNNWHPLVFTFIIILASFLLGKGCFMMLQKNITSISKIFVLYVFQMIISLVFSFVFFTFEYFHNTKIDENAIGYTVILSTFLNQFIFLYLDISLFPLFSTICVLSVIARYIKRPGLHIPIVILMILPFLIYAYLLLENSQINELKIFLLNSEKALFALSFILCPYFLEIDRIFISYAKRTEDKKIVIKYNIIIVCVFCVIIIALTGFYAHLGGRNEKTVTQEIIKTEKENNITCKWSDSKIFDDKIRSLAITIPQNAITCDIRLVSEEGSPILYSDNTYIVIDQNIAAFVVPSNPPERMWFSFGASEKPMTITVTIICPDSIENQFILKQKTVKINS